jgi:hypothetical protein
MILLLTQLYVTCPCSVFGFSTWQDRITNDSSQRARLRATRLKGGITLRYYAVTGTGDRNTSLVIKIVESLNGPSAISGGTIWSGRGESV